MILKRGQMKELIELIYLGNYVLNANKLQDDRITKYDNLIGGIYNEYVQKIKYYVKEYTANVLEEELSETMEPFIIDFERGALSYSLAQMLAEKIYPIKDYNDVNANKNLLARTVIEEDIDKNGLLHIETTIPDFKKIITEREKNCF